MGKSKNRLSSARTPLERAVQKIINQHAKESSLQGFLHDLNEGGCSSGVVGELVYYADTLKFYERHKKGINRRLADSGLELQDLKNWEFADPLALNAQNQNLLAWWAFEAIAYDLAEREGVYE